MLHPAIVKLMGESDFCQSSRDSESIPPYLAQFELGPGSKALVASTSSTVDNDLVVGVVREREYGKQQFPDYATRADTHLLLEVVSREDTEPRLAWHHRAKLIPIEDEHYASLTEIITERRIPSQMPGWLMEIYHSHALATSEMSPGQLAAPATCGVCESMDVEMFIKHSNFVKGKAGHITNDGKKQYVYLGQEMARCELSGYLLCNACGARGVLNEDDLAHMTQELHDR